MIKNKQLEAIIYQVIKKGFSCFLALLGAILMFIGALDYAKIPEAYYAGGAIMIFAVLFYIGEVVIRIIKIKQKRT